MTQREANDKIYVLSLGLTLIMDFVACECVVILRVFNPSHGLMGKAPPKSGGPLFRLIPSSAMLLRRKPRECVGSTRSSWPRYFRDQTDPQSRALKENSPIFSLITPRSSQNHDFSVKSRSLSEAGAAPITSCSVSAGRFPTKSWPPEQGRANPPTHPPTDPTSHPDPSTYPTCQISTTYPAPHPTPPNLTSPHPT